MKDNSAVNRTSDWFLRSLQKYSTTNPGKKRTRSTTSPVSFEKLEPRQLLAADFLFGFGSQGSAPGDFDGPVQVAINDTTDRVYVADLHNDRIQVFDDLGNYLFEFGGSGSGSGQLDGPSGLAIDGLGNIYVAEQLNNRVQVFDATGQYVSEFGSGGTGNGQFNFATKIMLADNGDIYVSDRDNHRVQVFDNSGTYKFAFGELGTANGQFDRPLSVIQDNDGDILVSDSRNDRIQRFDQLGNFLESYGNTGTGPSEFDTPAGISTDAMGRIYVSDILNDRVQVFDEQFNFQYAFGSYGTGDGEFIRPAGLAISDSGQIFVPEWMGHRVEVFQINELPVIAFSDSFESGQWNGLWAEDSQNDWFTSTKRKVDGSYAAEVDGWANNATLTVADPIDMSLYATAELSFSWFIESNWDNNEYIRLEFWNGNSWDIIDSLDGNQDQEQTWHNETFELYGLDSQKPLKYLRSDFRFRFTAKVSASGEDGHVDNVQLLGTSFAGPPNLAPSITSSENVSAVEDVHYSYDVEASDPDTGDLLTYSLDTSPAGMTIDSASGLIQWTPNNSQVGSNSVSVRVQDGGGLFDTQSFNVNVTNVNDAPTITSNPVTTATAESVYSYDVSVSDPDIGDTLSYFLDTSPAGMAIDPSGTIDWTPSGPQTGVLVSVRVQDVAGLSDIQNYSIDVAAVNHAPTITSSAVITATEDSVYSYDVAASDSDFSDTLTFSLDGAPVGMTIDGVSGLIQWTPSNDDVGVNSVTIRVADQAGAFDTQAFNITVANANDAPVISSMPVTTATEDQAYSYDVDATDVDPGDTLSFFLDTYPTGMTINGSSGLIQWTPNNGQLGNHSVTVRVDDGAGGSDSQNFLITVVEDSFTPTIVFSDNFEDGSTWTGQWSQDSQNDWNRKTSKKFDGSYAAEVDGRATNATLISDSIDMSGYGSADLTFAWLIEKGFDTNEFMAMDLKNDNGQWIENVRRLDGNVDQENTWHQESVSLDSLFDNYFHNDFQFRFRSTVSSSREDAYVDVVELKATSAALRGAVVDTNSKAEAIALVDLNYLAKWADQSWTTGFGSNHSSYEFRIADLPGNLLGRTAGNTITIDSNGAGMGWFVDRTPWESSEFTSKKDTIGKRYDLLSVLTHELGHLHGQDHADDGVMEAVLNVGERTHTEARDRWFGGIIENTFDDETNNFDPWFGNLDRWNDQ